MNLARIATSEIENCPILKKLTTKINNSNNSVWQLHKPEQEVQVPLNKRTTNGNAWSVAKLILSARGPIKIPHFVPFVISVIIKLIKWSSLHNSDSSILTIIVQQRLIGVKGGDQNHRTWTHAHLTSHLLIILSCLSSSQLIISTSINTKSLYFKNLKTELRKY